MAGSTEWRTPPDLFKNMWEAFPFNVDAAATKNNTLVKDFGNCYCMPGDWCDLPENNGPVGRYYTAETDGTNPEHYGAGDIVWCNPPYSPSAVLYRFVQAASVASERGALWVMLLPVGVDTRWFHDFIWDHEMHRPRGRVELRIPRKRVHFLDPDGKRDHPRSGNLIAIFRPPLEVAR